jgi:hypothetical protein
MEPSLLGLLVLESSPQPSRQVSAQGLSDGLDSEWARRRYVRGQTPGRGAHLFGLDYYVAQPHPKRFGAVDTAAPVEQVEGVLVADDVREGHR